MKALNKPLPHYVAPSLIAALTLLMLFGIYRMLWFRQLDQLRDAQKNTINLVTSGLRNEINKFKVIANVLADNKQLANLLSDFNSQHQTQLNQHLQTINKTTGVLDTYLMNSKGETIAASNWNKKNSFIGKNFSYRPYFQQAIAGQDGKFFAIGTSTNRRGFYIATAVKKSGKTIGAVVLKIQVEQLENIWRSQNQELMIIDDASVVFISTNPGWRLSSLRPLTPEERLKIINTRRYPNANKISSLKLMTIDHLASGEEILSIKQDKKSGKKSYLVQSEKMPEADWTVLLLSDIHEAKAIAFYGTVATGFGIMGLLVVGSALAQRKKSEQRQLRYAKKYRLQLEQAIAERTRDLEISNTALLKTQEKLMQSSRMAAIGRFSAGVSHEISQPLTAIHSYLSNTRQLLELERYDQAVDKLYHISDLVDRISQIIKKLRIFVRGDELITRPLSIRRSLIDAKNILLDKANTNNIQIIEQYPDNDLFIDGDDILLQQLFINLISNAMDAVADCPLPRVGIRVEQIANYVKINIYDNGPGIPTQELSNIFDPFYSTKKSDRGMGLGLTIAMEIAHRFNATLEAGNNTETGANFTLIAPTAKSVNKKTKS